MPSLIERFGVGKPGTHNDVFAGPAEPNSNLYHLRRFHYDTAASCNSVQMQGLKTIVGASQIVFGSDWPVCLLAATYDQVLSAALEAVGPISDEDTSKLMGGNASEFYGLS